MTANNDSNAAIRGSLALTATQIASRLIAIWFVVEATRSLGPSSFGRYSIVGAVVVIAAIVADFGTSAVVTRQISRQSFAHDRLLEHVIPVSAVLGVGAYLLSVLYAVAARYGSTIVIDVAIGALAVPAGSVATSFLSGLDGAGAIWQRATLNFTQSLVTMGGGLLAVYSGFGVRWAIVAMAVAPFVTVVAASVVTRHRRIWSGRIQLDPAEMKAIVVMAAPFAALTGLTALNMRFDVLLLSVISTRAETATYDVALRSVEGLLTMSAALTGPLLFLLSARIGRGDLEGAQRAFEEAGRLAFVVALPVAAGAVALHKPLAQLAFGDSFSKTALPLALLGAQIAPSAIGLLQGSLLMASEHARAGVRVVATATLVTIAFDVALIPTYGAAGAAGASLASALISVFLFARFHRRTSGIRTPLPQAGIVIAAVACGLVAAGLRQQPLYVSIGSGAFAYAAIIVGTGTFGPRDVRRILRLAR